MYVTSWRSGSAQLHVLMVCSSSWLAYAVLIVFALRFSLSLDSTRLFTMSVNLSTVLKWIKDMDSLGEWLRYDESGKKVTQIFVCLVR